MKTLMMSLLVCILALYITSCESHDALNANDYEDYSFQSTDITFVQNVPSGYILFEKISEKYRELVSIGFFEAAIYVLDIDGKNIKQTLISDHEFIVQHKDDVYINEKQIIDILAAAQGAADAQVRIYGLGEPIGTYNGWQEPTTVTINDVSYTSDYKDVILTDEEWLCVVEIEIKDNDDHFNPAWQYFSHAENIDGHRYDGVFQLDTPFIVFKLPKGEIAKYLFLRSPLMDSIRKVDIS